MYAWLWWYRSRLRGMSYLLWNSWCWFVSSVIRVVWVEMGVWLNPRKWDQVAKETDGLIVVKVDDFLVVGVVEEKTNRKELVFDYSNSRPIQEQLDMEYGQGVAISSPMLLRSSWI
ncbi:hypothetical protein E3N88_21713 [Mikania micrantha]|uniref:Uncharacterized protein n=1 Tax=Mikania micrantha TaxID=192012 RepID=A0A5N6N8B2_9ASTR|nr:hypothetical protein E3N88_21713 [Mikania micrantha]